MDSMFTIPFGEYIVADYIKKTLKNISIFIPSSRQEKGIDLIMYCRDNNKNKCSTIQVKQSKSYYNTKTIEVDGQKTQIIGGLWFNTFKVPENADWIMLTGIRAVHKNENDQVKTTDFYYEPIILAFKNDEMVNFISNIRQRKNPGKPDKMFGFSFDNNERIFLTRGNAKNIDYSDYLLKKRIKDLLL